MGNSGSVLIEAAQKNNTAKTRELIKEGIDINFRDEKGANALNWAAYNGNLELCMALVEHGININNQNLGGWTPLHDAAQNGHCEVIEFLLGLKNLDLTKKTSNGWSPLHLAASYGKLEAVKILIEHGMGIHQTSHTGFTPIDVCKSSIRQQVLDFLCERGTPYNQIVLIDNASQDDTPKLDTHEPTKVPSPVIPLQKHQPSIQISNPQPKYEEPPIAPPLPSYLKDKEGQLEHSDGRINYALHYKNTPIQNLPSRKDNKAEDYANVDLSVYNYTTHTDSEKNMLAPTTDTPASTPPQSNNNDLLANTNSRYSAHLRSRSFSSSPLSIVPNTSKRERSKSATPAADLRRATTSPDVSTVLELRQRISMYERQNEQLMKRVIELQQLTDVQQKVINEQKHKLTEKDKKIAQLMGREDKKERKAS